VKLIVCIICETITSGLQFSANNLCFVTHKWHISSESRHFYEFTLAFILVLDFDALFKICRICPFLNKNDPSQ